MKPNSYLLIERCIEVGLKGGWHKAHKHTDHPTPEQVWDTQLSCIMAKVTEWFLFEELQE
jgi:hypothetical protein